MKNKKLTTLILGLAVLLSSLTRISPPESYTVNTETSTVKWTAYHLAKSYQHTGHLKLKSGNLQIDNGDIVSGEFVIDMSAITNDDIEDDNKNKNLVKDLKSERFFNVEEFPEASLKITSTSNADNGVFDITAEITIRGITEEITFSAKRLDQDDSSVKYAISLEIDRIKHEVMYGWSIENAMLSNKFDLEIVIFANKIVN